MKSQMTTPNTTKKHHSLDQLASDAYFKNEPNGHNVRLWRAPYKLFSIDQQASLVHLTEALADPADPTSTYGRVFVKVPGVSREFFFESYERLNEFAHAACKARRLLRVEPGEHVLHAVMDEYALKIGPCKAHAAYLAAQRGELRLTTNMIENY